MLKNIEKILYHGSSIVVEKPIYGYGKNTNDYGSGFYLTEEIELAKEWACFKKVNGILNAYKLSFDNLKILDLTNHSILNWIAILVKYRVFDITTPQMLKRKKWLLDNYYLNVDKYDVIKGYRADDSYFSFARGFLSNELNLNQLSFAMRLGKLGEQIVLKSKKAFKNIKFIEYEIVNFNVYFDKRENRDKEARKEYVKILEIEDNESKKIDDLMKEKNEKARN